MPEARTQAAAGEAVDARALEQLRGHRVRTRGEIDLGGIAGAIADRARKRAREVGAVAQAWEVCVPEELRRDCELLSHTRGVVGVRASSSAARFRLDRWLRGGGEALLRREAKAPVTRVRIVTR